MSSSHVFDFTDVFRAEIAVINARRASQDRSRAPVVLAEEATDSAGNPILAPNDDANLVGLALSGGSAIASVLSRGVAGIE
jgi:hypothetical protein